MSKTFGFVQLDFAGTLSLADGRYLERDEGRERVLVLTTLGAEPREHRRRRRPKGAEAEPAAATLPLTRVTAVRAFAELDAAEADEWLRHSSEDEEAADAIVAEAMALLNRALHAQRLAAGEPHSRELTAERASGVRVGYGSGEELAEGRFTVAREIDVWATGSSRRRQREEGLRPQERVAAVLGGRERPDACETLLLRARADLEAGREREAALQLRVGLEALLAELGPEAVADPGHEADLGELQSRRGGAGEAANAALRGALSPAQLQEVTELLERSERVLRRRRVLRG